MSGNTKNLVSVLHEAQESIGAAIWELYQLQKASQAVLNWWDVGGNGTEPPCFAELRNVLANNAMVPMDRRAK